VLRLNRSLSAEQRAMVEELTSCGRGVEVVIGKAGTGKLLALSAARDVGIVRHQGHRLRSPGACGQGTGSRFGIDLHGRGTNERPRRLRRAGTRTRFRRGGR
jgi:hypothetical protein